MGDKAFNTLKSKCSINRGLLTKSINRLDASLNSFDKVGEDVPASTKRRKAAEVLECIDKAKEKLKQLQNFTDEFVEVVLEMDEGAIKDSTPDKVAESAQQACDEAEEKLNGKLRDNETHIIQAERAMEEVQQANLSQNSKTNEEKSINWKASNYFRPQMTLKPQILEKESTYLETSQFCETFRMYLLDGYRGSPPPEMMWIQLQPLVNPLWFSSLVQKELKLKDSLDEVINMILEESNQRNPLHQRRMQLLRIKKDSSHSEFLHNIEELMELIDFGKMTKEAFTLHLFIEQADAEMSKLAAENLRVNPEGDLNSFRAQIKQVESSTWYSGRNTEHRAKIVGTTEVRFCKACDSSSHNPDQCWGECIYCHRRGHQSERCRKKDEGREKAALAEKAKKTKVLKKRAKDAKKKEEAKAAKAEAKRATEGVQEGSESSMSEPDSPRRPQTAARANRVGQGAAKRTTYTLHEEIQDMGEMELQRMGDQIFPALRAKSAKSGDSPIIQGKIYPSRDSHKCTTELCVADTGCSHAVISENIVKDLKMVPKPFKEKMTITDASGNSLDIIGTITVFLSAQVLGERRRMVQAAVLRGNMVDREVLLSLQLLKKWDLVHDSFPNQTVSSYFYSNKHIKQYSARYSNHSENFTKQTFESELRKPSKACSALREKIFNKFPGNFAEVLGPNDRMSVDPVRLIVDEGKNIKPVCHIRPYDTPYHLRAAFEKEVNNAIMGEILVPCHKPTAWASKAFAVQKNDPTKVRIVADFRVLNSSLKRPIWPTESSSQLMRHIDPEARFFATIDATSGYHQVRVDERDQELLTIVTQQGRFKYTVTPQGVCSSSDLFNMLTDGSSRYDSTQCLKNMDDWLLHAPTLANLEEKITQLMLFCKDKNLKLNPSKLRVAEQVEFGGTVISHEIVRKESVVFIEPKAKRILAFEELKRPSTKKEAQVWCGMLASLQQWFPCLPLNIPLMRKACAGASKFNWTELLEAEYLAVKEIMRTKMCISPYDPRKELRLIVDGASGGGGIGGIGYVLFQQVDDNDPSKGALVISANSSMLTPHAGHSPIDGEILALDFAANACHFWMHFCPKIRLYSDCSGLLQLMDKPIADVRNPKHQRILTRLQLYNFEKVHIPGLQNRICDALSRLCKNVMKTHHAPSDAPRLLPMSKRAHWHKKQLEVEDPLVLELAQAGSIDSNYVSMCNDIENNTAAKDLPEDSELKTVSGLLESLSVFTMSDGSRIIVRDNQEIFVPKKERSRMLKTIHLTHPCDEVMLFNCKQKIFWPKMRQNIKEFYLRCEQCTENRISRAQPKNEIDYGDLFNNFMPGQFVEADFLQKGNDDFMVMVDTLSGFLQCYKVKNKSSAEAIAKVREWASMWGRPYKLKVDSGPGFRNTFEEGMKNLGIGVVHSSAYNSQSQGSCERGVRSIKELLKKCGNLSQLQLSEMIFCLNCRDQPNGQGNALGRFLGHGVRSPIPNSLDRSYNWDETLKMRAAMHKARQQKKQKGPKETYNIGEQVLVQNPKSKKWDIEAEISDVRVSHDQTVVSYDILVDGHESTRHRRFLRKKYIPSVSANSVPIAASNIPEANHVRAELTGQESGPRTRLQGFSL